jgi:triosephosphate isomerase
MKSIIAGNWKMHKTLPEALDFVDRLKAQLPDLPDRGIIIAPPFTALSAVAEKAKGSSIMVSAQNMHWGGKGAFTGEISARMISGCGCTHVILGHSERRTLFGETDADINRKILAAPAGGLKPIFCIGETLAEREAQETFNVIERQLNEGLKNISFDGIKLITVAYEPVWAIGTGRTASPEQAQEVHHLIRNFLTKTYGKDIAAEIPILYGGSVNPGNIDSLMAERDVNGALVGGASLEVESFLRIINFQ